MLRKIRLVGAGELAVIVTCFTIVGCAMLGSAVALTTYIPNEITAIIGIVGLGLMALAGLWLRLGTRYHKENA